MSRIYWILPTDPAQNFPPVERAFVNPNGLLAAGGDLSPARLLAAYQRGIFPWYEEGQAILWWSPNPRTVIKPADIHVSRSLKKCIRRLQPVLSINRAFEQVIDACASPRSGQPGTWITAEMHDAYRRLHSMGSAHSLEVWLDGQLVGGVYGVAIGRVFFGESMFSRVTNGSKIALVYLAKWLETWNFALLDCQVESAHLSSLGSVELPRHEFVEEVAEQCQKRIPAEAWSSRDNLEIDLI